MLGFIEGKLLGRVLTEGVPLGWKLGIIELEGWADTEGLPLDRIEGILEMLGS